MLSVESSLVPKDQEIWKLGDDFASKVVDVGVATGLMVAREIAIVFNNNIIRIIITG